MARDGTALDFSNVTEHGSGDFSVDASELGLPVGSWPDSLEAPIDFGNGRPLILSDLNEGRAIYRQEYGSVALTVWND